MSGEENMTDAATMRQELSSAHTTMIQTPTVTISLVTTEPWNLEMEKNISSTCTPAAPVSMSEE